MALQCTVCSHEKRKEIERAHLSGTILRKIVEKYGISMGSLHRHIHNGHIDKELIKAKEEKDVLQADYLLTGVVDLKDRFDALMVKAEKEKRYGAVASFGREIRQIFELLLKLAGQLKDAQVQNITIMNNPTFISIRTKMLTFLDRYPEVKAEFIKELEIEGEEENG
jgi:hypothetical protein